MSRPCYYHRHHYSTLSNVMRLDKQTRVCYTYIRGRTCTIKVREARVNDEELLDYLAGYFDANGCVTGKNDTKEGPILWCNVSTLHLQTVEMFKQRFGGYMNVTHSPDKQYVSQKLIAKRTVYQWRVEYRRAVRFAQDIAPRAQLKKPQLEILLALQQLKGSGQRVSSENKGQRIALLEQIRKYNQGLYAASEYRISESLRLPYIAGYFDGDGCVTGQVQNNIAGARCNICSADIELLSVLHNMFGGSIGKIFDVATNYTNRIGTHDVFQWQLSLNQSVPFITAILPYLLVKKVQAQSLLEMASLRHDRKLSAKMPEETRIRRLTLLNTIKTANQTGS